MLKRLIFYITLILLLIPNISFATTNGKIKGLVLDAGQQPIPGVLITVTSDNMMGERQAQTGIEGTFMLAELPPGQYRLEASRKGFTSVVRPNIFVKVNSTAIANLQLEMEGAAAEIIIEEQRNVIDTESGNQGSVLTKEFLQRIPAGRSYQQAAQLAVGVTGGANPNVGGASSNENTYL